MRKSTIGETLLGLLILGVNLGVGLTILIMGWKDPAVTKLNLSIWEYLLRFYLITAYTLLFGLLLIYVIVNAFINRESNKKEKVLLCKEVTRGRISFVDEKGRLIQKTRYTSDEVELNKYYKVMMTRNNIYEVLEETESAFVFPGIKISFWMRWYTPWEIYRDVLWLPIIYTIFFMFFPSIIPGLFILFLIVYDWYTKYRIKEKTKELIKEYPDYTFEQYTSIEDNVVALDAPFFGKIIEVWNKYKTLWTILIIVVVILLCYFVLWR